jgi:hypothetical protein
VKTQPHSEQPKPRKDAVATHMILRAIRRQIYASASGGGKRELKIERVVYPQTGSRSVPLKRSMEFWADREQTRCMTSEFLTQLAGQLRKGRSPACGRSIQGILTLVVARFEAGKYPSQVEAESEFRKLVNEALLRISNSASA